jgi:hypothetical protein
MRSSTGAKSTTKSGSPTPSAKALDAISLPDWALAAWQKLDSGEDSWLTRLWADPAMMFRHAGMEADPWQKDLLQSPSRAILLNCSRQSGKSQTASALALQTALLQPPALVLFLSPTERQSGELFIKTLELYFALGKPVAYKRLLESEYEIELANGSRIISLPGKEGTIRGYSAVSLLVIDEAARVPDALYLAVRPMLAVSGGRLIGLSTPFGRQGWFWEEWSKDTRPWSDDEFCRQDENWRRYRVPGWKCPRIARCFLASERETIGERWWLQEYGCEFCDMLGAVFSGSDIDRAFSKSVDAIPFPE